MFTSIIRIKFSIHFVTLSVGSVTDPGRQKEEKRMKKNPEKSQNHIESLPSG